MPPAGFQPPLSPPGHQFWPRTSPAFAKCRHAVRVITSSEIIVGLSGGADSLALCAALIAEGFQTYALCIDHQLQPQSREVAEQAARQARELGTWAKVEAVTVAQNQNLEAAARTARYSALHHYGLPIAVGHTADDQAETFLLSALRGHGTGMAQHTTDPKEIWRPLLEIRRHTTHQACQELGLKIWEDPHNHNPAFRRVALRHHILPQLATLTDTDPIPALAAAATAANEEQQQLQQEARQLLNQAELHGETPALAISPLQQAPKIVRAYALREYMWRQQAKINNAQLQAIQKLITQWHGQGPVAIPGGRAVYRRGRRLCLEPQEKQQ